MKKYQSDINRILSLIYDDQPIAPSPVRPVPQIPERIRAVRSLGRGAAAYRQSRETVFVHQAHMLADYEDDFEYEREVRVWFPTYESLTDEQLRGYLGFRSRVRRGIIRKESDCFAFLYLYELLNLIGCKSAEDAFYKMTGFLDVYGKEAPLVLSYGEQWLIDFVLYYELDPALLKNRRSMLYDRALAVLLRAENREKTQVYPATDEEKSENRRIFKAFLMLSGMQENQLSSLALHQKPGGSAVFEAVLAATFYGMCRYFRKHRKTSFLEDYAGGEKYISVQLFSGAVFHDISPVKGSGTFSGKKRSFTVPLGPVTVYHCEMGRWSARTWRRDFKNSHFSELLKTIDCLIREAEGESEVFPEGLKTKWIRKLICDCIAAYQKEEKEADARRVEINLNMLDGIRSAAEQTMGKLMTEEEMWSPDSPLESESLEEENMEKNARISDRMDAPASGNDRILAEKSAEDYREGVSGPSAGSGEGLDETEIRILQWLLDPERYSRPDTGTQLLSVIVDHINEKLFDRFSDLVIENGSEPEVIEDYREELRELLR